MGAWGEKAFENDSALDWLAEFEAGGLVTLRETLSRVADHPLDDYLDVDDGASTIAAAEIVAAALGRRRDRVPNELGAWLDAHQGSFGGDDQRLARRAVERVLADGSELRELWEEGETESAWHADVRTLLIRLGAEANRTESARPLRGPASARKAPAFDREKQALVTFLQARGLHPTREQMERIHASRDGDEIKRWLARVVTARSVAEMLER